MKTFCPLVVTVSKAKMSSQSSLSPLQLECSFNAFLYYLFKYSNEMSESIIALDLNQLNRLYSEVYICSLRPLIHTEPSIDDVADEFALTLYDELSSCWNVFLYLLQQLQASGVPILISSQAQVLETFRVDIYCSAILDAIYLTDFYQLTATNTSVLKTPLTPVKPIKPTKPAVTSSSKRPRCAKNLFASFKRPKLC